MYSKVWYTAQSIMLDEKMLKELDKRIRNFIHAGENERPVQALVYREKEYGGLGLICPVTKSRAFLVKSMYKQWKKMGEAERGREDQILYGNSDDLESILNDEEELCKSVKSIYSCLLETKVRRGDSWIPSRAEKKNPGIRFKNVWENQNHISKMSPQLKYFSWCLGQDMVVVGARKNRANQRKECQQLIENGQMILCEERETLTHALATCRSSREKFDWMKK